MVMLKKPKKMISESIKSGGIPFINVANSQQELKDILAEESRATEITKIILSIRYGRHQQKHMAVGYSGELHMVCRSYHLRRTGNTS